MSDRYTSNILLTDLSDSTYEDFGHKSVAANRYTQPLLRTGHVFGPTPAMAMSDFQLPTKDEREAFQLRKTMGWKDHQIAKELGISRITVNRRIRRYIQKARALIRLCPSASCELLERLATN